MMTQKQLQEIKERVSSLAQEAQDAGETPIGAIVFDSEGRILAAQHNQTQKDFATLAHAEVLAIASALKKAQINNLGGCSLMVTLEPCLMCLGALINVNIKDVYYLAKSPESGAFTKYHFQGDIREHYLPDENEEKRLKEFFAKLRN